MNLLTFIGAMVKIDAEMVFGIRKAFGSPKIKEEDNNERHLGGGKENQLKKEAAIGPPLGWKGQAQHQHLGGGVSEVGDLTSAGIFCLVYLFNTNQKEVITSQLCCFSYLSHKSSNKRQQSQKGHRVGQAQEVNLTHNM